MQWSLSAARATKSALRRACDSPLVYDISSAKHGDSRLAAHSCVKSTKSELNGKCLRFARSNKGLNFSVNGFLNTGGVHDGCIVVSCLNVKLKPLMPDGISNLLGPHRPSCTPPVFRSPFTEKLSPYCCEQTSNISHLVRFWSI